MTAVATAIGCKSPGPCKFAAFRIPGLINDVDMQPEDVASPSLRLKGDDSSATLLVALPRRGPHRQLQKITCNSDDCTTVLQAAINSGADVELQPGLWSVDPIHLNNSHQTVRLKDGAHVQAKRGSFQSPTDCLFSIRGVVGVSLIGAGAANSKLSMWKVDYRNASLYKRGEWRCGVNLCGSKSVTVANLTISDTGGDGLYVGALKICDKTGCDSFETGCSNIVVDGVVTDGAYRNGLSLISGANVLVENCQFLRTGGTAPQAGVVHPHLPAHRPPRLHVSHLLLLFVTLRLHLDL